MVLWWPTEKLAAPVRKTMHFAGGMQMNRVPCSVDSSRFAPIQSDSLRVASICSDLLQFASICSDSLRFAPIHSDSLQFAPTCFNSLWFGPFRSDSPLFAPIRSESLRFSPTCFNSLRIAPIRYDSSRFTLISSDLLQFGPICSDSLRFAPIRSDSLRFDLIRADSLWLRSDSFRFTPIYPILSGLRLFRPPKSACVKETRAESGFCWLSGVVVTRDELATMPSNWEKWKQIIGVPFYWSWRFFSLQVCAIGWLLVAPRGAFKTNIVMLPLEIVRFLCKSEGKK